MSPSSSQNIINKCIEVSGVSKEFSGREILKNITFTLNQGDRLALIGSSGCGKSTLLHLVAGLEIPDGGKIYLNAQVASSTDKIILEPHERKLSMVFQDLGLWPNFTVQQNIELGISKQEGLNEKQRNEVALSVMEKLGISHLSRRKPGQLSGGEQQRVALARATVCKPKVLLLDEPFTGLDWLTKKTVVTEIKNLISELKMSLILVTHNPEEAEELCSRVLSIENGSIVEDGLWPDVMKNPQSKILQAYANSRGKG